MYLHNSGEANRVISEIFNQAKYSLYVRAGRLEQPFFTSEQISLSITSQLRRNQRYSVCFLIDDPVHFITSQSRITELARNFSSYVKVHQPLEGYESDEDFYIVADAVACLYQAEDRTYPVVAEACAPSLARKLERKFKQSWERSTALDGLFTSGL